LILSLGVLTSCIVKNSLTDAHLPTNSVDRRARFKLLDSIKNLRLREL
jgi:hypothetical protein